MQIESLLQLLNQVEWLSQANRGSPNVLTRAGIPHGFCDKAQTNFHPDHFVKQVHGTRILQANFATAQTYLFDRSEADGIYTNSFQSVGVKSADCLPVLLADVQGSMVMAVHAGWRGLSAGILQRAIQEFQAAGVEPQKLVAVVGPAISLEHYEVGFDVVEIFKNQMNLNSTELAFGLSKGKNDRWHLDLSLLAIFALLNLKIPGTHISALRVCTYANDNWFSYRREGGKTGRNWSWIARPQQKG